MSALAKDLGEIDLYSEVALELADGTTVGGLASPIDFVPYERLRMELRPTGERSEFRYVVEAHKTGDWETPTVRGIEPATETEWNELGTVESFSVVK